MSKKQVLISVGTYTFNPLLEKMDNEEMINVFKKYGYNRIVFQTGRYFIKIILGVPTKLSMLKNISKLKYLD